MIPVRLLAIVIGVMALLSCQIQIDPAGDRQALPQVDPQSLLNSPLSSRDEALAQSISTSEWLGPLAPVAISPFFGITCLAAISQFGGDYLPLNQFVSNNSVLQSPAVFWIFLCLTLLTSLPRLTKVSKPFAQALDQVEAYAGIITILVLRFSHAAAPGDPEVAMVQMGFLSMSADLLLSVAAILNIIVINSVKFFFEILVWIIPIPFVDAILEACNKALCAGLMAIYAWSPLAATVINLLLFTVCFFAFNWIRRRVTLARTMLWDPIWATISSSYGELKKDEIVMFLKTSSGPFPAKAKVVFERISSGWKLTERRWLLPDRQWMIEEEAIELSIHEGLFMNSIEARLTEAGQAIPEAEKFEGYFSRRYNDHLDQVAARLRAVRATEPSEIAFEI